MSNSDSQLNRAEKEKRLGLLGLAADRQIREEPCPDDEYFATFLESDPASPGQHHFLTHLAACESCRQKWLVLSEELDGSADKNAVSAGRLGRRSLLSLAGSVCAVAVGVMLYLSIDYRPAQFDGGDPRIPERPAKSAKDQDQRQMSAPDSVAEINREAETDKLAPADAPAPILEAFAHRQESRERLSAGRPTTAEPRSAEAPLQPSGSKRPGVLADEEGFASDSEATHEPTRYLKAYEEFIDQFLFYCTERKRGVTAAAPAKLALEQGRTLLEANGSMAPSHKELTEDIIQLLGGPEPVKDTELDPLCEEAGRVMDEIDTAAL
jgi:hypothetical protein